MIPRYRAWDKTCKTMYEADDIVSIDFEKKQICVKTLFFERLSYYDFDDVVLMQSTGLRDKNGKEIFEGDVLKFNDSWENHCYEGYVDGEIEGVNYVEIQSESTGFIFCKTKYPDSSLFYYANEEHLTFQEILGDGDFGFEVVGNIYENPELAEVSS
ncbi:YopX family protein [Streptococcus salivarius]